MENKFDIKAIRRRLDTARWDEISVQIQNPELSLADRAALR